LEKLIGLHIGCGPIIIRDEHIDWTNIDIQKCFQTDLVLNCMDVAKKFPKNSIDFIWTCHMLEHLNYPDNALKFLEACYTILKPGGIMRIAVPDLRRIAQMYVDKSPQLKAIYGDCKAYYVFDNIGERFNYFLKEWEHKIVYDYEMLESILRSKGFKNVEQRGFKKSRIPGWSHDRLEAESMFVEAEK